MHRQVLRAAQAGAEPYCSGLGAGTGQHGRDGDDGAEDDGVRDHGAVHHGHLGQEEDRLDELGLSKPAPSERKLSARGSWGLGEQRAPQRKAPAYS